MIMEETPIWNAMLTEYPDPFRTERIELTEHPIYDVLVASPPDPLIREHE